MPSTGVAAAHPSLSVDVENKVDHPGRRPDGRARSAWCPAAAPATSRCTAASSATGCSTPPARARCSPRRCPTRCSLATKAVNGGAGVLHIVKNYTGDVLNFQMAAELADDEGIEVVPVVINDDVAVQDSLYTAGRRGTGATVFVEKIAGALAEEGADAGRGRRGGRARSTSGAGRSASR